MQSFEFGTTEPEPPPIDVFRLDSCRLDSLHAPSDALLQDIERLRALDEYENIRAELDKDPTRLIKYQVEHVEYGESADGLALDMLENRNLDRVCRNCYPRKGDPVIDEEERERERTLAASYFGAPPEASWSDVELAMAVYLNTRWMLDDAANTHPSTVRAAIRRVLERADREYTGVPATLLSYWKTLCESRHD